MGIKHLREENGSGLVLTLMVLLVLSVLGISIGTLTIGSYRLGAANRDATSAYYVAEAGAVTAYEEIQSQVLGVYNKNATEAAFYESISGMVSALPKQSSVDFDPQFGSKPTATITTARQDEKTYIITSTGEVDGKKRTVTKEFTVNWIEKNTGGGGSGLPALPANAALLTEGDATVVGNNLIGDIYAGGDFHKPNGNVVGNVYANENVTIRDGTLIGDIYTNSTQKGGFHIEGWIDLRTNTVFHSDKIQADDLLRHPGQYVNKPIMVAKESVWDGNAYLKNFQGYKNLLDGIKKPNITEKLSEKKMGTHIVQDKNGNVKVTNYQAKNYVLDLVTDVYIPELDITWTSGDSKVKINTNGKDRAILVDNLNIAGNVEIIGGGKLTIYITKSFPQGYYNLIKENSESQLNLVYLGTSTIKIDSGSKIDANIIIKSSDANVKVEIAGGATFNGVLLTTGNKVDVTGGAKGDMMLIAPTGTVTLNGSGSINGSVIAKQFTMSGGASLTYSKDIDTSGFPSGGTSEPAVDPELGELIIAGTIIEN